MPYEPGFFKGKRITVMGLGLLGRGVGDARFFAEEGAELVVTDLKTEDQLKTSIDDLKGFPNIRFVLGEHRLEDFRDKDFILKAAGVPLDSPYVAEARKNGVPVEMSTALFASLTPAAVFGVTGTRGKSTVTHLVYHMLVRSGRSAFLGGNVRGMSTLPLVRSLKAGDVAVLELDSWQLQGFGERNLSPRVSVFTNFMPDHQNYYKNDMDLYFADKANIFKFQREGDTLVVGRELYEERRGEFAGHAGRIVVTDGSEADFALPPTLMGEHNRKNAACAVAAAEALGVPKEEAARSIGDFEGLEGRLEFLREMNGVRIYNDTNSTTPDATLAGLEALAKDRNVVLIMGGADKTLSMAKLVTSLDFYCRHIVLLPGTGTDRLPEFGFGAVATPVTRVAALKEAFDAALAAARPGDIVLLSPGFASFGLFKNEYDRGDQFKSLVSAAK